MIISSKSFTWSVSLSKKEKIRMDQGKLSREQFLSVENGLEKEDEELDPRVKEELDKLNTCSDEINRLETQLDEANATFRSLLSNSTQHLKSLSKKLGSSIEKARPYFEGADQMTRAQAECQRAAVQFQRASDTHTAAKETISLAEERFLNNSGNWQFDTAWQEMLNHATIKVIEAEKMKTASEKEHLDKSAVFSNIESKVKVLEKKLRKHIKKSKHYFDQKAIYNKALNSEKARVGILQAKINASKTLYTKSFKNLEDISEAIHARRKMTQSRLDNLLDFDSLVYDLSNIHLDDQDTISTIATDTDLSSSDAEVGDSALGSTCISVSDDHCVEGVSKLSVDGECSSMVSANKTSDEAVAMSGFNHHDPLSRELSSRDALGRASSASDNIESMHDTVSNFVQDIIITSSATIKQSSQEESSQSQGIFNRIDPIKPATEADGDKDQEKDVRTLSDATGNKNEPVLKEEEKTVKVNPRKPVLTSTKVILGKIQPSSKASVGVKHKQTTLNASKPATVIPSDKAPRVALTKRKKDNIVKTDDLVTDSKSVAPKFGISSQSSSLNKSGTGTVKPPSLQTTKFRKRKSIGAKLVENKAVKPVIKTLGPKPNQRPIKPMTLNLTSIKPKLATSATNPQMLSDRTPKPKTVMRSTSSSWQTSTEPKPRLTQSKSSSALQTPSMPTRLPGLSRSSSVASKMSQPRFVSTVGKRFTSSIGINQESQESVKLKSKPNCPLKASNSPIPASNKSKVVLPSIKESVRKPLFRGVRDCDSKEAQVLTAAATGRPGARRKPGSGV